MWSLLTRYFLQSDSQQFQAVEYRCEHSVMLLQKYVHLCTTELCVNLWEIKNTLPVPQFPPKKKLNRDPKFFAVVIRHTGDSLLDV